MISFIVGLVVGSVTTILVFRRNKAIQAKVEGAVDIAKSKIDHSS